MGDPIFMEGVDLAFGVSLPEGLSGRESVCRAHRALGESLLAALGEAAPSEGLGTAELPLSAFAGGPKAQPGDASPGPGFLAKDICVRVGSAMADPGCSMSLYRAAMAQCRSLSSISAFVLEFPFQFAYGTKERRHVDRVTRDMEGLPLSIAFFNPGWYSLRVIEALKERGIGLCLMDFVGFREASAFPPPRFDMATSSLVYLKLYGCAGTCGITSAGGTVGFGDEERRLASWKPRLEALAPQAGKIRVVFQGFPGPWESSGEET
jgi:hypothetical protein